MTRNIEIKPEAILEIAQYERDLINDSELLRPLNPVECWAGGLAVRVINRDTPLRGSFPAVTHYSRKKQQVEVDYDSLTHSELVLHYTQGDEQIDDLTRQAYIGAGLVNMLFMVQGAKVPMYKLTDFAESMADQDNLLGKLYEALNLKPKEGVLRKLINSADAPAQINGLRLTLGMWKNVHGNAQSIVDMQHEFRQSLEHRIKGKPQYIAFANIFKASQEEAEDMFGEHISDIQIAAACPMEEDELAKNIKIIS